MLRQKRKLQSLFSPCLALQLHLQMQCCSRLAGVCTLLQSFPAVAWSLASPSPLMCLVASKQCFGTSGLLAPVTSAVSNHQEASAAQPLCPRLHWRLESAAEQRKWAPDMLAFTGICHFLKQAGPWIHVTSCSD